MAGCRQPLLFYFLKDISMVLRRNPWEPRTEQPPTHVGVNVSATKRKFKATPRYLTEVSSHATASHVCIFTRWHQSSELSDFTFWYPLLTSVLHFQILFFSSDRRGRPTNHHIFILLFSCTSHGVHRSTHHVMKRPFFVAPPVV